MEWPTNPTQEDAHGFFARRTNGHTWDLLDQPTRTAEEDALMIAAAYASLYHWRHAGTPANWQRAEWLIARVYAGLGNAGEAMRHAQACRDLTRAHPEAMEDFDLAFEHEAMARAFALNGEVDKARAELRLAEDLGRRIGDPEDRRVYFECLAGGDWRGLTPPSG